MLLLFLVPFQSNNQILIDSHTLKVYFSSAERTLGNILGLKRIDTNLARVVVIVTDEQRCPLLGVEADIADLADNILLPLA